MATQWSNRHGELYLRREWLLGEVEDVEGLKVVLWLNRIEQWRSSLGGLLDGNHCLL
jgi:hypothetical protein